MMGAELWDVLDSERRYQGRVAERGRMSNKGDYHLIVQAWVRNGRGEVITSRRSPEKKALPLKWECTQGSAIAGESSLDAALREVKEELGIELDPENGRIIKTFRSDIRRYFCDVWLFSKDVETENLTLQEGETCDAKWVHPSELLKMRDSGEFVPIMDYLDWLVSEIL